MKNLKNIFLLMPIENFLVKNLGIGLWPVALRKPLVKSMIRRKSLSSLPFTTSYRGFRFEGDAANMIDYHVLSRGGFEVGLAELLNVWGASQGDGVFLDVGANVGIHTLAAARCYKRVLAVEPFPQLAGRLEKTLSINSIENVSVVRAALADEKGSVMFQAPSASNMGTGRIVGNSSGERDNLIEVSLAIGDEIVAAEGLPLRCAKIDTEGAEKRVLAGLADSLERDRPLVIFELLEAGSRDPDVLRKLFPVRYRFFLLKNIKRRRFELHSWESGYGDIVAVPYENLNLLREFIK